MEEIIKDGKIYYKAQNYDDIEKILYNMISDIYNNKSLSSEENDAVMDYVSKLGGFFSYVNNHLRAGGEINSLPDYYLSRVKNLDSAISKQKIDKCFVLYRAIKDNPLNLSREELLNISNISFEDKGYMSTSLLEDGSYAYFDNYPIVYEIFCDETVSGIYAGLHSIQANGTDDSDEFILARGTTLAIENASIRTIGGKEKIVITALAKCKEIESITR